MNRRTALKAAAVASGGMLLAPAREVEAATGAAVQTAKGGSIYYRDWGAGRPVVFAHGWSLNADFWQYQMLHLSERGCRAVGYDRRGHGRSSDPGRGYDYDTLADDLAALIGRLDLRGVTLVGHSMGAGEVVRYLTRHGGGRVARLVLVGGSLPFLMKTADNPEGVDKGYFDRWRGLLASDWPKWNADNEAPFWTPDTSPAMLAWGRQLPFQASLKAVIGSTYALTETDFRAELARIRVPTLLVHGARDRSVPIVFARRTAALVPNSRLVEYDDAPHGLPLTHMARFNAELEAFING